MNKELAINSAIVSSGLTELLEACSLNAYVRTPAPR